MSLNGSALEAVLRRYGLELVTRAEWGASAPRARSEMFIPSPRVWVHHAAVESSDDAAEMRAHQAFHMDSRGWNDLAYSLALPDPNPGNLIFEGRGIGIAGGHTATENTESHGILVMGNFQVDRPSNVTIDVLVKLLKAGRAERWWVAPTPASNIGGHRDAPTANTSCPGNHLYARLPEIRTRVVSMPPPPPPPPPPPEEEEDEMKDWILRAPDRSPALVRGEKVILFVHASSIESLKTNGDAKEVELTQGDYDRIVKGLSAPVLVDDVSIPNPPPS